ncbi:MAG: SusD/RagB family nutrient-binding outer membrane lipoprotein [Sphingobacteriia bacterium]|nr:SusD/RagB family nutrient-binding outer membrane lipoprotein [Sphingobacteriia bacterium]
MNKIKIGLFAIVLTTFFSSCQKYLDVNSNPNSPTDVPPNVLLPNTSMGIGWANANVIGLATGLIMQYNAAIPTQWQSYDVYALDGSFGNQWNYEIYNGCLNNLVLLISKTNSTSPAYSGIAKIQKAYIMAMATDLWGDVPYSQAGQGLTYPQPRFDKQEDIYKGNSALGIQGLIDLTKEGLADLDKASVLTPSSDDLVYGGSLVKWKRAANSLLLKLAIQLTNVDKPTAKSLINSVIAGNLYINDNSLDLNVPFSSSVSNQNPAYVRDISGSFKNNECLSSRFLTLMRSLNDTVRLAKFYTKPNNVFTAYTNGNNTTAPTAASRSVYNTYVVGTTGEAPARLITNFQTQFILAEAALVLGTTGDANTYYQNGIKASMKLAGMLDAEINNYFTTNPTVVNLAGTQDDQLKQIITQKYIAWTGNGYESYNDYRRTGYPVLTLPLNAAGDDPTSVPKRFPYIATEGNSNPNQPNPRVKTNVKVWWGQ